MIHVFHSNFKLYIEGLIEQKHALGYSYRTKSYILRCFDRFCTEHYPQETELTKEIALHWAERKNDEHTISLKGRITPVRQLAKYMNSIGIEAYIIPQEFPGKCPRYVPHIFTDNELQAFLQKPTNANMTKEVRQDILCFR